MHQARALRALDSQPAARIARGLCMALGFTSTPMLPSEVAELEHTLGISLPDAYRQALQGATLKGSTDQHPEFVTDPAWLARENRHFRMDPEDLSENRTPGLVGALKFYLLYGSGKRLLKYRRQYVATWANGSRFIIGTDLSEENYYILLTEPSPKIYSFQMEDKRSRKVAESVEEWLVRVKHWQDELEDEA